MTPYKVYLEYDGQQVELESGELTEERPTRGKLSETHRFLETGIFSCKIDHITLKTFISFQDNIYIKFYDAMILVPTKDLVWGKDDEIASYIWKDSGESSVLTWHNYLKDWAFTLDWPWRTRNE